MPEAFFLPDGDRYVATELTRGPWDPGSQHAGPPAALVGREIERAGRLDRGRLARVTYEIVRPIPIGPVTVTAQVTRPGRSVELVDASLHGEKGDELVRARAWRIRSTEVDLDGGLVPHDPPPPGPAELAPGDFFPTGQEIGYHTAMEARFASGAFLELGPATAWFRMRCPLVAGEEPTPLDRVLAAADSGNGISATLDFHRYLFVNTDLTVGLMRPPAGEWVCLESATYPEPSGVGLTDTALWDERGRIG
ncbi:MAG TPA: thioesterase family protein, partial [Thermoleophilaceae bacterium]|nr:thioesterase family protein [Thermoleophilaceae bacterium]